MDRDALIGTLFAGRFRIEALLGSGGMASVYLARDETHGRVALKLLHRRLLADVEIMGRFRREARAISLIEHPNIARVLDFGHSDLGVPYLAMEHVAGPDLGCVLAQGERLSPDRALSVLSQVAAALAAAHEAGVVHRDLKPSNVALVPGGDGRDDRVKVLDFGMAKILRADETASLSIPGATYGTPEYMSPEQISGEPLDHRTDVYSFGILAFELVAGRPPFVGSMVDVMDAHLSRAPGPPSQASNRAVPPGIDGLVAKCLEKQPDRRYQDAKELRGALSDLG
jgi:serine/threonine-protein kinase